MEKKSDVVEQEREVSELLESVPPKVAGARFRRARIRMGFSIRDAAEAARVSKNSIVRFEKGGSPHPLTVLKLCSALGIHIASLARPVTDDEQVVAIHRRADDRWYDLTDFGAGPLADQPLSREERQKLVEAGAQVPLLILSNRLETGRLLPTLIELHQESEPRSHQGEEMVFVLRGRALLKVGGREITLEEGESATFWSAEEHSYAPAEKTDPPPLVLSIRIDDRPSSAV